MQLDVYIEKLKLAVEYQGEQHYRAIYWVGPDLEALQRRDREKRLMCLKVTKIVC